MVGISVVIPVYNTDIEKLDKCISSIINQTYKDFEIIIIDDGSNDTVVKFLNDLSRNNSKIKVYFQEHLGVSRARNFGVEKSQGNYVVFVDSDDYIYEGYFESSLYYAKKTGADLIIGGIEFEYSDHTDVYSVRANEAGMWLYSGEDKKKLQKQLLSGVCDTDCDELAKCLNASPCSKLYTRKLISKVCFDPEITIYEDMLYIFRIIREANKICLVNCVWYTYFQYSTSSLHKFNPTLPNSFDAAMNQIYQIVIDDMDYLCDSTVFLIKYIELLLSNYYVRRECKLSFREKITQIQHHFSHNELIWVLKKRKTSKLSVKEKIVLKLVIHKMYFILYFLARIKSGR